MSDEYRPTAGSGGQPDDYYQSLPDSQLLSIYEGSAVNSPAYIAVMAELRKRGYSFNDPESAHQPPPQTAQQQYSSQSNYNSQPNMPPNQQQQYGAPQYQPRPMGNPPYSAGGISAWQSFFVLIAIAIVVLLLAFANKMGYMNETVKIIVSITLGMMIMSSGYILSGVRHMANLKQGFHTSTWPGVYMVFGSFWMLAFLAVWISSLIDIIKLLEYSALASLISLAVTAVISMFPLVQFFIFKTIHKQLSE